MLQKVIADGSAVRKLKEIVQAQGGDPRAIDDYSLLPRARATVDVVAPQDGFITVIDTEAVGLAAVALFWSVGMLAAHVTVHGNAVEARGSALEKQLSGEAQGLVSRAVTLYAQCQKEAARLTPGPGRTELVGVLEKMAREVFSLAESHAELEAQLRAVHQGEVDAQVKELRAKAAAATDAVARRQLELAASSLGEELNHLDLLGRKRERQLAQLHAQVALLERARVAEAAQVEIKEFLERFPSTLPTRRESSHSGWVSISVGCNNTCTFCIVPSLRGKQRDRRPGDVLAEVEAVAAQGAIEVTLLGQNVNSYGVGFGDRGAFAKLLRATGSVEGIERVRFTTSHPHDLSDELIEAFRTQPKIMPHFHLPVQSGSNPVLKRMRRDYTVVQYLERLEKLRAARPGIAVTTDIIVGFPGETEEDFALTLELTEKVRYENQFSFIYSPRPKTGAALKEDEWGPVPHEVKIERLERLQKLQRRISGEHTASQVGLEVEVMVEGHSRYNPAKRFGRTPENRTVNFDGDAPAGAFVKVLVESATPNQLSGKQTVVLSQPVVVPGMPTARLMSWNCAPEKKPHARLTGRKTNTRMPTIRSN